MWRDDPISGQGIKNSVPYGQTAFSNTDYFLYLLVISDLYILKSQLNVLKAKFDNIYQKP